MHPEILSLSLFAFVTSCSPGPNNIVASYSGFNFGITKTIPHMLGVIFGFTILVTITNFGLINIFQKFDFIQELRAKGHKITTGSLGMAASMAGILLQAGDVRWIGHQSWVMIHRAAFGAIGKTYEVEDEVKLVKRIEERILNIVNSKDVSMGVSWAEEGNAGGLV